MPPSDRAFFRQQILANSSVLFPSSNPELLSTDSDGERRLLVISTTSGKLLLAHPGSGECAYEGLWLLTNTRLSELAVALRRGEPIPIPKLDNIEEEKDTYVRVRDALQRENDAVKRENDALGRENDALGRENDALKRKNNALERENDVLKKESDILRRASTPLNKAAPAFQGAAETSLGQQHLHHQQRRNLVTECRMLQSVQTTLSTRIESQWFPHLNIVIDRLQSYDASDQQPLNFTTEVEILRHAQSELRVYEIFDSLATSFIQTVKEQLEKYSMPEFGLGMDVMTPGPSSVADTNSQY